MRHANEGACVRAGAGAGEPLSSEGFRNIGPRRDSESGAQEVLESRPEPSLRKHGPVFAKHQVPGNPLLTPKQRPKFCRFTGRVENRPTPHPRTSPGIPEASILPIAVVYLFTRFLHVTLATVLSFLLQTLPCCMKRTTLLLPLPPRPPKGRLCGLEFREYLVPRHDGTTVHSPCSSWEFQAPQRDPE